MQENMDYQQLLERCQALEAENMRLNGQVEELRNWAIELEKARDWFKGQNDGLLGQIEDLKGWVSELEKARDWFKNQNDDMHGQIEDMLRQAEELRAWISQLEANRDWMAAHDEDQQKSIKELQDWTAEVEAAKNEFVELHRQALEDKMLVEAELERMTDSLAALEAKLRAVPGVVRRLMRL